MFLKCKYKCFSTKTFLNQKDTIFAIASGFGKSAIAILRISGPNSSRVLSLLAKNEIEFNSFNNTNSNMTNSQFDLKPRYIYNKIFYNPFNNFSIIDKGLIFYFKSPKSFTGEGNLRDV